MTTIDVHVATRSEAPAMAAALGRAFFDDPVMSYLLRDDTSRTGRLEKMFSAFLYGHYLKGGATFTDAANAGASMGAAPGHAILSPLEIIGQGHRMLGAFGVAVPRALRALSAVEKVHPKEPHWYLGVLGTDPSAQGKGVGGALLQPILDRCDAEGLPAYLESSKDRNVPYYERFGFRVTGEIHMAHGGPTVWPMWRDPQG